MLSLSSLFKSLVWLFNEDDKGKPEFRRNVWIEGIIIGTVTYA